MSEANKTECEEIPNKEKKKSSVLEYVVTILIVLFAVYCVVGFLNQKYKGETFYIFGYKPVVILSGSMEPDIKTYSIVIVNKTKSVSKDDVVFFKANDGTPVVHRLIEDVKEGMLTTKGDANEIADFDKIPIKQLEGKVVAICNWAVPIVRLFQ